jgi:Protein of unknown function (DUF2442)
MIKVLFAEFVESGIIQIEFSNGLSGLFNLRSYLDNHSGTLLEQLKDETYAKRCFIDAGALCWPNGLELSPNRLYELCSLSKAA